LTVCVRKKTNSENHKTWIGDEIINSVELQLHCFVVNEEEEDDDDGLDVTTNRRMCVGNRCQKPRIPEQ
jgi:hypothetical protein